MDGTLILTGSLVLITAVYATSAELSRRDASARWLDQVDKQEAEAKNQASTATAVMTNELDALRSYLSGLEANTNPPYPRLHLVSLDLFLNEARHLPPDAVKAVIAVEYQLSACNEFAHIEDRWKRRTKYLRRRIATAQDLLSSHEPV